MDVFTPTARGEEAVHGTVAPWVAWSADFGAGPGISGPATVVVASADAAGHAEPWFVRVSGYPGLGSALAWDRPLTLGPASRSSADSTSGWPTGGSTPTRSRARSPSVG